MESPPETPDAFPSQLDPAPGDLERRCHGHGLATDGGVAAPSRSPQNPPLQGTTWQLVGIQSMDDAQGLKRPANPSRYTLSLQADGRAVLQLDCNRATGSWQVEPSTDPGNGGFRFGPLASTKALCPAPSLGEPLARQLPYVRGYLLRDGRLNLSLLADGGILIWEPRAAAGPGYSNRPDPALESAILAASPTCAAPWEAPPGAWGGSAMCTPAPTSTGMAVRTCSST